MVKDHVLLREYSGKPWSHGSQAREYLEKLPVANAEENFRETDTRYLLPRRNIFTFGLQNGITERVIYYTCNMCHAFVKPHDVKHHMITRHSKQECNSTSCSNQIISTPLITSRSKKSSHKSKKKVILPPSVPPPPLFPKVDFPPPATVTVPSSIEDLLPPVLQPIEMVETKISSSHKSSERNSEAIKVKAISTVTLATTTATVTTTASNTTVTATVAILPTPSASTVAATSVTTTTTSSSNLPPLLSTQVSTKKSTVNSSKTREKSSKSERDKRKRSKRSKTADDFNPDKHCGVLDSSKRPCMRTLTCANHTIIERRAVAGRSKNIDKLISEYKASRVKNKVQPVLPVNIAPKQCSSLKEVRSGMQVMQVLFGKDNNQNNLKNADFKCTDDPLMSSVLENLASIRHRVPKTIKPSTLYVPPSPEIQQVARVTKLPPGTFLKVSLSQPSPPLPGTKVAEVPSQTPTLYSAHPKPMTMLTTPVRRVGSSFVLQQQAQRLERQRLDLQAVVNQHKQLKVASPNKQVYLLNSNQNKQSILKSNIKNNAKSNPLKRPSVEKSSVNDIKHMKVISTDMNGFIFNTDFTENNETQPNNNTVQDKIALLK